MRLLLETIAHHYDLMPHGHASCATPYDHLKRELWEQYRIVSAYLSIEFTATDPYPTSAAMFRDIDAGRLRVYTGADLPHTHPFAPVEPTTGERWNSIFRAVHDGIAHYPGRHSFGLAGELRAFQAHCRLLSQPAQWAIATETLAQDAWYHYGPHSTETPKPYAPQKAMLLPWALVAEALRLEV